MHNGDFENRTIAPDNRPEAEQPAWRQDYPIDTAQDHYVSRREFTKSLVWVSLATFLANAVLAVLGWLNRDWDGATLPQAKSANTPEATTSSIRTRRSPASLSPGAPRSPRETPRTSLALAFRLSIPGKPERPYPPTSNLRGFADAICG